MKRICKENREDFFDWKKKKICFDHVAYAASASDPIIKRISNLTKPRPYNNVFLNQDPFEEPFLFLITPLIFKFEIPLLKGFQTLVQAMDFEV